jgi:TPR repeat protein
VEAIKWYRKAADQQHAVAQFSLGIMCANGEGVPHWRRTFGITVAST